MQDRYNQYFWDGKTGWSNEFRFRRILEYASFPDLIHYPFDDVKKYIDKIRIQSLWTGKLRKEFITHLKPYIQTSDSWEEAIQKMLEPAYERLKDLFKKQ
jgi:hypothetical protein